MAFRTSFSTGDSLLDIWWHVFSLSENVNNVNFLLNLDWDVKEALVAFFAILRKQTDLPEQYDNHVSEYTLLPGSYPSFAPLRDRKLRWFCRC